MTQSMYRLMQFDTLEGVAERFLGTPARWPELVQLNELRYPYIAQRPQDLLGPSLSAGLLTETLPAPAMSVLLPLMAPTLARKGGQLYLEQLDPATGALRGEMLTLAAPGTHAGDTTRCTFTTPTERTYYPGATWYLTDIPSNISSRVLQTGDLLRLPSDAQGIDTVSIAQGDLYSDRLGRDAELQSGTGRLLWDSTAHDLQTVAGVANLTQALRNRLATAPGELAHHVTYGNPLWLYVGLRPTSMFPILAEGQLRLALNSDPRVESVPIVLTSVAGDTVRVHATVRVRDLANLVQLDTLGLPPIPLSS